VARTIADLDLSCDAELITEEHIAYALQLRVRLRSSTRLDAA
jgi:predicted ATPase with chaperone activity